MQDYFKLRLKQKAGTLSGDEQQMLAVGRALMVQPELLLLNNSFLLFNYLIKLGKSIHKIYLTIKSHRCIIVNDKTITLGGIKMSEEKKKLNRRSALKKLGGMTAGAALGGMALANPAKVFAGENSEFPWPYKELDVERVRKLGHEGYYLGNCASGSFYAIMSALDEKVGAPYDEFPYTPPDNMMHFGGSGMGQGMCCGALLGSFTAINLLTDSETASELISELMSYYKDTELPTDTANEYGTNREYLVDEYHSDEEIAQTVADSAMCRDSVGTWMSETGISHGDLRRKERCSRLTGDIVAKAVELLNQNA